MGRVVSTQSTFFFFPPSCFTRMQAEYVRAVVDKSQYKASDPNNTFWAKDQSRFGLKMLKNMGWSEGRGLGAKEDGEVSHIPIKKKISNAGIGETNNSSDNWLQGAFDYNNLLKRLNASKEPAPTTEKSAVKNTSKSRHMYQKRLASRDAAAYSREDLDLILGTTKLHQADKVEEEEEELSSSEDEDTPFLKTRKVSVTDYFLKKGSGTVNEKEVFEEEESFGGVGLGFSNSPVSGKRKREEMAEESSTEQPKAKKVKKSKKSKKEKAKKKEKKEKKVKKSKSKSKDVEEPKSKRESKKKTKKNRRNQKNKFTYDCQPF